MPLSVQAKLALELFNRKIGGQVSRQEIIISTRWSAKTVDTYINKKWINTILSPIGNDHFSVILKSELSEDSFYDLQTQVDPRVRN
ncbi:TPA: hypothetical protein RUX66_003774 [Aeromonas dhakensis]|nr:hypothetical protein [Aeromonas dhakensis]